MRAPHRERAGWLSGIERPKRLVTPRLDGDDFVVSFYPEDAVVFRHTERNPPPRKMCSFLHQRQLGVGTRRRSLPFRADYLSLAQRSPLMRFDDDRLRRLNGYGINSHTRAGNVRRRLA